MPWPLVLIAVLIPIASPRMLQSGPPELPKLIEASVWMKSWNAGVPPKMLRSERPVALTMPTVTEPRSWPSGLPIAIAQSPTRSRSESPSCSTGRSSPLILMTATSVSGSVPITLALNERLSFRVTVMSLAFCTTWLLVRMCPSRSMMKPDPELGIVLGCRISCPKKRRNSSSWGSSESAPPTFFLTSTKTTAGSARSTTPTNGLSVSGAVVAASAAGCPVGERLSSSPALRPRPMTSPTRISAIAPM